MDWGEHAACRGLPTAWWYGDRQAAACVEDTPTSAQELTALLVCSVCPVANECVDDEYRHYVKHGEHDRLVDGIRGGMKAQVRIRSYRERVESEAAG